MIQTWVILFLPGFLIALVVGLARHRSRARPVKLLLIATGCGVAGAALAFGASMAFVAYALQPVITDHSQHPLTVQQARAADCPVPLPDAATHVQFEQASGGLVAFEILVRFEAPVAVCRAEAETVCENWDKENGRPFHPVPLTAIDRLPPAEDGDMVGRAAWFDAQAIEHGVIGEDGNVRCWIDQDRGVFYCKITD